MERASASCYFLWRTALVTAVVVAGTLGVFLWQRAQDASLETARTAAVNTLVVFEAFYQLALPDRARLAGARAHR